ncbi:hypothetical protein LXA43DRAFT_106790 [Ganoderma leucocontextum]|nr:hypothetical protein LXA43DRAFT_106790 [Ganoderma leucocontextum]
MPPRTPRTPVMAGLNAALSMFRSTPRTSISGGVELPQGEDEPLVGGDGLVSEKCELRIEGMTCGACVESIEGMLRSQAGIYSIKVALLAERGVVEYDPNVWDADKIVSVSLYFFAFPLRIGILWVIPYLRCVPSIHCTSAHWVALVTMPGVRCSV